MPFCTSCGQELTAADRFCTSCGAPAGPLTAPVMPVTQASPPPASQDEIRWTNKVLGFTSDYFVNPEGAGQAASKKTSDVNTGLAVAGTLLGSLSTAGAGILAKSREDDFIRWDESRSVALNRKKKTVTVTRKSLIFPIRLYCTDENYDQVVAFIRKNVDPALIEE
ncbi:MAG TPA: zinc ribbon domain-containing protein [Methanoregulaceae archaeon]|nr:zinc ribbon domain-containing protein [Methanoregulaceae archaeon]HQN89556.1 zinc ribbon domain-containing protein [Methanoregulaceae archaeon]HQP82331.1 zinc ribbon domain-containing protein [Methanoregulaceae archaeon]